MLCCYSDSQTLDPTVQENSIPTVHNDHEATPTPETVNKAVESEGLNVEGSQDGGTIENSSEGVTKHVDLNAEPGENGVKTASDIVVQVTAETPEAVSSELSQTSGEGVKITGEGEGEGEEEGERKEGEGEGERKGGGKGEGKKEGEGRREAERQEGEKEGEREGERVKEATREREGGRGGEVEFGDYVMVTSGPGEGLDETGEVSILVTIVTRLL